MGEELEDAISLVGSRVALVAGPGVDNDFLSRVRKLVHSDDPFGSLVGALTDAGLDNVPSLACAVTERGGVRLIVRGAGRALVKLVDGRSEVATARGVSTWTEHAAKQVEEVVLVAPNAHGAQTSLVLFLDPASQRRRSGSRARREVEETPVDPPVQAAAEHEGASSAPVAPRPTRRFEPDPSFEPFPEQEPAAPFEPPTHLEPAAAGAPTDDGWIDFDHLLGQTQYRGVEAAAVRPLAEESSTFSSVEIPFDQDDDGRTTARPRRDLTAGTGDHDGNTVSLAELRALTGSGPGAVPSTIGSMLPPVAPVVGRLRFDDGQLVDVDGLAVFGRQPVLRGESVVAGSTPRLISLPDPEQALSRSHAEVRVEGGRLVVVDLGSTNGTIIYEPDGSVRELVADEPIPLARGARVELAGVVSFTLE